MEKKSSSVSGNDVSDAVLARKVTELMASLGKVKPSGRQYENASLEEKIKTLELFVFLNSVACSMGGTLHADPDPDNYTVIPRIQLNGLEYRISKKNYGADRGRLIINVSPIDDQIDRYDSNVGESIWNRVMGRVMKIDSFEITASGDKQPSVIANDIKKRITPKAEECLAKSVELLDEINRDLNGMNQFSDWFVSQIPGLSEYNYRGERSTSKNNRSFRLKSSSDISDISVSKYGDADATVSFKVSGIPNDLAIEVINLISMRIGKAEPDDDDEDESEDE